MRIGVDDGLQLSFRRPVPLIAVRVVTPHQPLVGAAHLGRRCRIAQAEHRQRGAIAGTGPAPLSGGRPRPVPRIGAEQVMGIAETECLPPVAAMGDAFPAGERRLRLVDLVDRQAVEEIIAGVEFADMVEAQELPAALVARQPIRQWRAELAGPRATGMVARCLAGDPAVQALAALGRFG